MHILVFFELFLSCFRWHFLYSIVPVCVVPRVMHKETTPRQMTYGYIGVIVRRLAVIVVW